MIEKDNAASYEMSIKCVSGKHNPLVNTFPNYGKRLCKDKGDGFYELTEKEIMHFKTMKSREILKPFYFEFIVYNSTINLHIFYRLVSRPLRRRSCLFK